MSAQQPDAEGDRLVGEMNRLMRELPVTLLSTTVYILKTEMTRALRDFEAGRISPAEFCADLDALRHFGITTLEGNPHCDRTFSAGSPCTA